MELSFIELLLIGVGIVVVVVAVIGLLRVNRTPYRGKPKQINWDAVNHPTVKSLLPNSYNQEAAAEAYQRLTGVAMNEAKNVIAYVVANWDRLDDLSAE